MTEFGRGDESMNAVGYTLVFGTVGAFISLLTLWLFAENCWSKRIRIEERRQGVTMVLASRGSAGS